MMREGDRWEYIIFSQLFINIFIFSSSRKQGSFNSDNDNVLKKKKDEKKIETILRIHPFSVKQMISGKIGFSSLKNIHFLILY